MPALRPAAGPRRPPLPAPERASQLSPETALALLRDGSLDIEGRLVDASNTTLFCTVSSGELAAQCVYKPVRGERPLWDFPDGTLALREVAAFLVSVATGWGVVPPTVLRDGPLGEGMVQLWIDVDETVDPVALVTSDRPELRRMAVFDAVVNNADRKGGHLLPAPEGHIYGVDHGVCFHVEPKLRTVLWGWRSTPFDDSELAVLRALHDSLAGGGQLATALAPLLHPDEIAATRARVKRLLSTGLFPEPDPDWPAIPWPPF